MKHIALLTLAVLTSFVFAGSTIAQDYLPLIQKDTISLTQVNLENITSEDFSESIQKVGSAAIDYFLGDNEDVADMKKSLPLISMLAEQVFIANVQPLKDAGVKSIYFVVDQPETADVTLYPYLALPTKDLDETQKKQVREAFSLLNKQIPEGAQFTLKYRLDRHGFYFVMLVPTDLSADEVKAYTKEHFAKLTPVQKPEFTEAFKAIDPSALVSSVTLNVQNDDIAANQLAAIFSEIEAAPNADEFAQALKDSIVKYNELGKKLASHVKYSSSYVSLKNLEIVSNIKANSANDAKEYIAGVNEELIPEVNQTLDKIWEQILTKAEEGGNEISKETLEEAKEQLKKLINIFVQFDVNDSDITWKMNEKFWSDNKETIHGFIDFVKANASNVMPSDTLDFEEL